MLCENVVHALWNVVHTVRECGSCFVRMWLMLCDIVILCCHSFLLLSVLNHFSSIGIKYTAIPASCL